MGCCMSKPKNGDEDNEPSLRHNSAPTNPQKSKKKEKAKEADEGSKGKKKNKRWGLKRKKKADEGNKGIKNKKRWGFKGKKKTDTGGLSSASSSSVLVVPGPSSVRFSSIRGSFSDIVIPGLSSAAFCGSAPVMFTDHEATVASLLMPSDSPTLSPGEIRFSPGEVRCDWLIRNISASSSFSSLGLQREINEEEKLIIEEIKAELITINSQSNGAMRHEQKEEERLRNLQKSDMITRNQAALIVTDVIEKAYVQFRHEQKHLRIKKEEKIELILKNKAEMIVSDVIRKARVIVQREEREERIKKEEKIREEERVKKQEKMEHIIQNQAQFIVSEAIGKACGIVKRHRKDFERKMDLKWFELTSKNNKGALFTEEIADAKDIDEKGVQEETEVISPANAAEPSCTSVINGTRLEDGYSVENRDKVSHLTGNQSCVPELPVSNGTLFDKTGIDNCESYLLNYQPAVIPIFFIDFEGYQFDIDKMDFDFQEEHYEVMNYDLVINIPGQESILVVTNFSLFLEKVLGISVTEEQFILDNAFLHVTDLNTMLAEISALIPEQGIHNAPLESNAVEDKQVLMANANKNDKASMVRNACTETEHSVFYHACEDEKASMVNLSCEDEKAFMVNLSCDDEKASTVYTNKCETATAIPNTCNAEQASMFFQETVDYDDDIWFEFLEDKHEFEEYDLALHIPGQESILSKENMEILFDKLSKVCYKDHEPEKQVDGQEQESTDVHVGAVLDDVKPAGESLDLKVEENEEKSNDESDESSAVVIQEIASMLSFESWYKAPLVQRTTVRPSNVPERKREWWEFPPPPSVNESSLRKLEAIRLEQIQARNMSSLMVLATQADKWLKTRIKQPVQEIVKDSRKQESESSSKASHGEMTSSRQKRRKKKSRSQRHEGHEVTASTRQKHSSSKEKQEQTCGEQVCLAASIASQSAPVADIAECAGAIGSGPTIFVEGYYTAEDEKTSEATPFSDAYAYLLQVRRSVDPERSGNTSPTPSSSSTHSDAFDEVVPLWLLSSSSSESEMETPRQASKLRSGGKEKNQTKNGASLVQSSKRRKKTTERKWGSGKWEIPLPPPTTRKSSKGNKHLKLALTKSSSNDFVIKRCPTTTNANGPESKSGEREITLPPPTVHESGVTDKQNRLKLAATMPSSTGLASKPEGCLTNQTEQPVQEMVKDSRKPKTVSSLEASGCAMTSSRREGHEETSSFSILEPQPSAAFQTKDTHPKGGKSCRKALPAPQDAPVSVVSDEAAGPDPTSMCGPSSWKQINEEVEQPVQERVKDSRKQEPLLSLETTDCAMTSLRRVGHEERNSFAILEPQPSTTFQTRERHPNGANLCRAILPAPQDAPVSVVSNETAGWDPPSNCSPLPWKQINEEVEQPVQERVKDSRKQETLLSLETTGCAMTSSRRVGHEERSSFAILEPQPSATFQTRERHPNGEKLCRAILPAPQDAPVSVVSDETAGWDPPSNCSPLPREQINEEVEQPVQERVKDSRKQETLLSLETTGCAMTSSRRVGHEERSSFAILEPQPSTTFQTRERHPNGEKLCRTILPAPQDAPVSVVSDETAGWDPPSNCSPLPWEQINEEVEQPVQERVKDSRKPKTVSSLEASGCAMTSVRRVGHEERSSFAILEPQPSATFQTRERHPNGEKLCRAILPAPQDAPVSVVSDETAGWDPPSNCSPLPWKQINEEVEQPVQERVKDSRKQETLLSLETTGCAMTSSRRVGHEERISFAILEPQPSATFQTRERHPNGEKLCRAILPAPQDAPVSVVSDETAGWDPPSNCSPLPWKRTSKEVEQPVQERLKDSRKQETLLSLETTGCAMTSSRRVGHEERSSFSVLEPQPSATFQTRKTHPNGEKLCRAILPAPQDAPVSVVSDETAGWDPPSNCSPLPWKQTSKEVEQPVQERLKDSRKQETLLSLETTGCAMTSPRRVGHEERSSFSILEPQPSATFQTRKTHPNGGKLCRAVLPAPQDAPVSVVSDETAGSDLTSICVPPSWKQMNEEKPRHAVSFSETSTYLLSPRSRDTESSACPSSPSPFALSDIREIPYDIRGSSDDMCVIPDDMCEFLDDMCESPDEIRGTPDDMYESPDDMVKSPDDTSGHTSEDEVPLWLLSSSSSESEMVTPRQTSQLPPDDKKRQNISKATFRTSSAVNSSDLTLLPAQTKDDSVRHTKANGSEERDITLPPATVHESGVIDKQNHQPSKLAATMPFSTVLASKREGCLTNQVQQPVQEVVKDSRFPVSSLEASGGAMTSSSQEDTRSSSILPSPPSVAFQAKQTLSGEFSECVSRFLLKTSQLNLRETNDSALSPDESNMSLDESSSFDMESSSSHSVLGDSRLHEIRSSVADLINLARGSRDIIGGKASYHRLSVNDESDQISIHSEPSDHDLEAIRAFLAHVNDARESLGLSPVGTATAIKYLLARNYDAPKAVELYHDSMRLRKTYDLDTFSPHRKSVQKELSSGKFTILPLRREYEPFVALVTASLHNPTECDHVTAIQALVFQLDEAMRSPVAQRCGLDIILDMTGANFRNIDLAFFRQVVDVVQNGYPARLNHVYVVSPPMWMRAGLYVRLCPNARKKIEIVTPRQLTERLPLTSVPLSLGGLALVKHKEWLRQCIDSYDDRAAFNDVRVSSGNKRLTIFREH
ncbi:uncharacterized protein LOC116620750 isoform X3 [Nematostella vectensis]|uniref:uncharacterized protein LOC116620750 isoform X3 n=1 Tax=Nematostella vectensis TaxID=45351 RepID=UPI0020771435|nr:uncharacterized protein LOC116620750 isoform X3 [Nematostella vectensis]